MARTIQQSVLINWFLTFCSWKCNFPMTRSVHRSVGSVGCSVCHKFLKGRKVTLPCSYRSTSSCNDLSNYSCAPKTSLLLLVAGFSLHPLLRHRGQPVAAGCGCTSSWASSASPAVRWCFIHLIMPPIYILLPLSSFSLSIFIFLSSIYLSFYLSIFLRLFVVYFYLHVSCVMYTTHLNSSPSSSSSLCI